MNTFSVLGWDFMVDENLKVWMIECNRGPDLSASTSITEKQTGMMQKDLATMFCDYDYKDVNTNDKLTHIGLFYKYIDSVKIREVNKLF